MKVLVIDDSLINLKIARHTLQHAGYDVTEASNGLEGVKMARGILPSIILLDIEMPNLGGVKTLKMLRSISILDAIPVVALTASSMTGDKERLLGEGFDDYISKPVNLNDLIEKVGILCGKSK